MEFTNTKTSSSGDVLIFMKTRRDFLASTLYSVSTLSWLSCLEPIQLYAAKKKEETLLVGGFSPYEFSDHVLIRRGLAIIDSKGKSRGQFETPHDVHWVASNPHDTKYLYAISIEGTSSLITLGTGHRSQIFAASQNCNFTGHAVFMKGGVLATSEADKDTEQGYVVLRDGKTLEIIRRHPSFGKSPHQLWYLEKENTFVIANKGVDDGESFLAVIDANGWHLKRKIVASDERLVLSHFSVSTNGDLFVGSGVLGNEKALFNDRQTKNRNPRCAKLLVGNLENSTLTELSLPKAIAQDHPNGISGLYLSLAIHPTKNLGGATDPSTGEVVFFDLKKREFLNRVKIDRAAGIELSQDLKSFWVTDNKARLYKIGLDTLALSPVHEPKASFINGSHLLKVRLDPSFLVTPVS